MYKNIAYNVGEEKKMVSVMWGEEIDFILLQYC